MPNASLRLLLARIGVRWRLAGATVCVLLAAISALEDRASPSPAATHRVAGVVVAARNLPAGRRLAASDLRTSHAVRGVAGAISAPARLRGRVLAGPLVRGEPVTTTRLLDGGLTVGLPADVAAVPLDVATDVRGVVRAGGRVDLLAVPGSPDAPPEVASSRLPVATRLAGRALVLAVLPPDPGSGGCRLVLALTRADAARITGARSVRLFHVVALPP